jgi:thiamine kinase-like enzyme
VTLWERVERAGDVRVSDLEVARSLQRVHADLAACNLSLPSFRITMDKARQALFDDNQMRALPLVDREFLRRIFDRIRSRIDQFDFQEQPLHGEPHEGNFIPTASGIRWLDFENARVGPLEWDLAFLTDDVRKSFSRFDADLLQALRALLNACIATWCGIQAHLPELRAAGAEHLQQLRAIADTYA